MAKAKQSNVSKADRVQLLQAVTKSVNKVAFNPSKARKDEALKAIDSLRDFVVAQSKPKAKAKPKASEPKAIDLVEKLTKSDVVALLTKLMELDGSSEDEPSSPQPKAVKKSKPKAKRKAKATGRKRTASEMVADSDEMKRQPKAVGPIAKGKKKTANVVESADKVASLGKRNATAKAAKVAQKKQHGVSIPNDCAFSRNEGEAPQDAIRRRAIEDAKRKALEAELLADFNDDEVTGQIELNF